MPNPRAYLLTWTCYGTWLHGDERGSVDPNHNQFGAQFAQPNLNRNSHQTTRLKSKPQVLDHERRQIVEETITVHCKVRNWTLLAVNVRTNHVHVVVASGGIPPKKVTGQFKSWSTRRLRESELVGPHDPVWTDGGSSRFLWDDDSVVRAVRYVFEGQGDDLV